MNVKRMFKMALVTMGTIYAANMLASMNPTARKLIKGASVVGVAEKKTVTGGASSIATA